MGIPQNSIYQGTAISGVVKCYEPESAVTIGLVHHYCLQRRPFNFVSDVTNQAK